MTARCTAVVLLATLGSAAALAVTGASAGDPAPVTTVVNTVTVVSAPPRIEGRGIRWWRNHAVQARKDANARGRTIGRLRRDQHRRWAPTLASAVRLASAVTGVPEWQLRKVAYCESTDNPLADNGSHFGYWQLSWSPFGLSPFDPYAAALSTAMTVKHDGGWRQWRASFPCHGLR